MKFSIFVCVFNEWCSMDIRQLNSLFDLKSLPVSLSGACVGAMLAVADYHVGWKVVLFLLLTAVFMHMLSAMTESQAELSSAQIRNIRRGVGVLAALSAVTAIYFTYGTLFLLDSFVLMIAFWLVMNFASGHAGSAAGSAVWRRCLRDVFLYGPVGVCGSFYLCSHTFSSWFLLLPALSVGMLCAAARLHDHIGSDSTKYVQTALVSSAWILMIFYSTLRVRDPWHFLFVLTLPAFIVYLVSIWRAETDNRNHNGIIMAVLVFAFSLLSGFGFLVFLL